MKHTLSKLIPPVIAAVLLLAFGYVLLVYAAPMKDVALDLSLISTGEAVSQITSGNKGWTVYTQEGDTVRPLENNGRGHFLGIELGQTFYMSRVLEEDLDSPTLQIGTAERSFIVWLDDEVVYTDWPELDPVPGQLRLPMNTAYRSEPITITLPMNYRGKTLTIAQSTPEYLEGSTLKATPASVKLYCGYAYESGIVAESYSLAITAGGLFVIGLLLLLVFLRQRDWSILCIALNVFLNMMRQLQGASFHFKYFGISFDLYWFIQWFSALSLMAYLVLKAGNRKTWTVGLLAVCILVTPVSIGTFLRFFGSIHYWHSFLFNVLPQSLFLVTLTVTVVFGCLRWRKENRFYRIFIPMTLAGLVLTFLLRALLNESWLLSLWIGLASGAVYTLFLLFLDVVTVTALVSALWDALKTGWERRAERNLMEQHREMTLSTYENMRRQHEAVMKLRHDMAGHLEILQGMTQNTDAAAYIENLIGQNARIRSVIHTGNEVLDIILGSKLSKAHDKGIQVEVDRCSAPKSLPIADAELSSIVINILSNAITGAERSGAAQPTVKLDIHTKDEWFSFTCENSADIHHIEAPAKKETVPKHGLGLKIIQETVQRSNGLFSTEYGSDYYKVSVILPLNR